MGGIGFSNSTKLDVFVIADFTADSPRCLVLYHDSFLVQPSSVLLFLNIFLKAVH